MEIRESQILITGANRGIGKAVALMCAEDKAHLHLVIRTPDEKLKAEMMSAGAKSCEIHVVDLAVPAEINSFLEKMRDQTIDILVNNAGLLTGGLLENQKVPDIYKMMQVNLNALIHLTHGFLPGMLKRKRGKIVNNSSVSAVMNFPSASTYAASKAAVISFTSCLRQELKDTGVTTLTLITPGIETRMYQEIPKFYGQHIDSGFIGKGMQPKKYAQMIREAILEDLTILKPHGVTGLGLSLSQHLPTAFENLVSKKFRR